MAAETEVASRIARDMALVVIASGASPDELERVADAFEKAAGLFRTAVLQIRTEQRASRAPKEGGGP